MSPMHECIDLQYAHRYITYILYIYPVDGLGFWSENGCEVLRETSEFLYCQCDHLTSFAVIQVSCIYIVSYIKHTSYTLTYENHG